MLSRLLHSLQHLGLIHQLHLRRLRHRRSVLRRRLKHIRFRLRRQLRQLRQLRRCRSRHLCRQLRLLLQ